MQLCIVRNKRRIPAKRYRGAAGITCRRARKGFDVKFNPDSHWSHAFYKGLDEIQLKDDSNKLTLNRDDQAGFRLDCTYTHKHHKAVCLEGKPELTSHSDYISKYRSYLQVTSCLFMEAENTGRVAVGIVKAPSVLHEKTATQHLADLYMLRENPKLDVCFEDKEIDCIRVDGGSEEGPAHLEVQFRWTEWHLKEEKEVTLVTTRNSGASCFNLVELQNGVIGRAHANLFIPSTLTGSAETETGYSEQKHRENMEAAIEVYLSRIQEIPFGPTVIKTCRGATDQRACKMKSERNSLLIFLRGSKAEKKLLQASKPELYQYFQKIWALRKRHMVKNQPSDYVFQLKVCYQAGCDHPVCQRGRPPVEQRWYAGGPPLSYLPFPVPDPDRPWGSSNCDKCEGSCSGHYLDPSKAFHLGEDAGVPPPNLVIKTAFQQVR